MFRSLGKALSNKEAQLKRGDEKVSSLDAVVRGYTQKTFGQEVGGWKLVYDEKKHHLTIHTDSKTLATELFMRREEIEDLLDHHKIPITRVIIR